MTPRIVLLLVTFLWLAPTSSFAQGDSTGAALRIDGVEISADEYAEWLIRNMGERQARTFALDAFVVEREARRLALDVSAADVSARVRSEIAERIRGAFFGRKEEWLAELARTQHTESGVVRQRETEMRPWMLSEKIAGLDRVVPEEKVEREWWARYGRKGRKLDLLMMKFKVETASPEKAALEERRKLREDSMQAGRARALAARARVVAGEDFGKVARELSEDPDTRDRRGAPSGGFRDVGWNKTFLEALDRLSAGDISEPLYSKGGFWILKVNSIEHTPLESVRSRIVADLVARGPEQDEVGAVMSRLQANVQVQVLPALWDPPRGGERPAALEPAILVDGDPVTRGAYARWLVDKEGESAVSRFLEEWTVERKARELGITVDDSEVEERVRQWLKLRIEESFEGQREGWLAFLVISHRSEDSFLREIASRMRVDLLTEKLILRERKVTKQDVELRFRDEYGPEGERIDARWIVVIVQAPSVAPDAGREVLESAMLKASEAARARATALVERVRRGEDFAAVAREESDDAETRADGGRRPGRFRQDMFPDEIGKAVVALKAGEVTDPLFYGNSYLVFQVAERRRVKLEDVAAELEHELLTARPTLLELGGMRNTLVKELDEVEILPGMVAR